MTTEPDTTTTMTADADTLILQIAQQLRRLQQIIRQKNARIAELEQRIRQVEQKTNTMKTKKAF